MVWPLKVETRNPRTGEREEHNFGPMAFLLGSAIGACIECGATIWLRNVQRDVVNLRAFAWPVQSRGFPHPLWSAERPDTVPAQVLRPNLLELAGVEGSRA